MVSRVAKLLKGRSQDKRRRIEAAALALFMHAHLLRVRTYYISG